MKHCLGSLVAVLLLVVLLVQPSAVECGSGRAATDGVIAQNVSVSYLPDLFDDLTVLCFNSSDNLYLLTASRVIVFDTGLNEVARFDFDNLHRPVDMLVTAQLDLFIADEGKSTVLRFDPNGDLKATYHNSGPLSDGKLLDPRGIALDMNGQLVVADRSNNRLVLIDTVSGDVTGYVNGDNSTKLLLPYDVAIDATGRIYVCDLGNNRTVVFAPNGTAVLGVWDADSQVQPARITVDLANNVYVSDTANSRSLIYSPQGELLWNQTWDQDTPDSVAVTSTGLLFIADNSEGQVIIVSDLVLPGAVLSVISGGFTSPKAVAVTRSASQPLVYVVDATSGYVQAWSPEGVQMRVFNASSPIANPWGVAVSSLSGQVYVTDKMSDLVLVYNAKGALVANITVPANLPQGLFVDDGAGRYYVAAEGGQVCVYGVDNTYKGILPDVALPNAAAVAVSPVSGLVYVLNAGNNTAGMPGSIIVLNGSYSIQPSNFGPLNRPYGIAVDVCNNVYVSEAGANRLTIFNQNGVVLRTVSRSLNFPTGVALDRHGTIYVADTNNDRIVVLQGLSCQAQPGATAAVTYKHAPATVAE